MEPVPALNSPMFVVASSGRRSDVSKRERMLRASTQVNMDDKGPEVRPRHQAALMGRPQNRVWRSCQLPVGAHIRCHPNLRTPVRYVISDLALTCIQVRKLLLPD